MHLLDLIKGLNIQIMNNIYSDKFINFHTYFIINQFNNNFFPVSQLEY